MSNSILTQELLCSLFEYKNGELHWKIKPSKNVKIGAIAGTICTNGYRQIKINSVKYLAHRVVFLFFYGYLPKEVDHIDHNKLNNNIENLRPANCSNNSRNVRTKTSNTTGFKNVTWNIAVKKYRVNLRVNGKQKYLGSYDDIELANLVAHEARDLYYGDFACHI